MHITELLEQAVSVYDDRQCENTGALQSGNGKGKGKASLLLVLLT